MTKKTRKKFSKMQRDKAVDDYISGERTAAQIAHDLKTDVQNIYRWKTMREEKAKDVRVDELIFQGNSKEQAKKILLLELEVEAYQKKVAEQAVIIDLLKKLQTSKSYQPESELSGLIETSKVLARKRRRAK
tara:strand:+ start:214 stop:609 length:396 start_codon:yes stop_codon:yes gene_type:complete